MENKEAKPEIINVGSGKGSKVTVRTYTVQDSKYIERKIGELTRQKFKRPFEEEESMFPEFDINAATRMNEAELREYKIRLFSQQIHSAEVSVRIPRDLPKFMNFVHQLFTPPKYRKAAKSEMQQVYNDFADENGIFAAKVDFAKSIFELVWPRIKGFVSAAFIRWIIG